MDTVSKIISFIQRARKMLSSLIDTAGIFFMPLCEITKNRSKITIGTTERQMWKSLPFNTRQQTYKIYFRRSGYGGTLPKVRPLYPISLFVFYRQLLTYMVTVVSEIHSDYLEWISYSQGCQPYHFDTETPGLPPNLHIVIIFQF